MGPAYFIVQIPRYFLELVLCCVPKIMDSVPASTVPNCFVRHRLFHINKSSFILESKGDILREGGNSTNVSGMGRGAVSM